MFNRKKSGKIKTEYKQEFVHTNLDVDFNFAGPTVYGAAVVGFVFAFVLCLAKVGKWSIYFIWCSV